MATAIHITHEATQKIGGIGTVLHGLLTSKKYRRTFKKTLLYTPLFNRENDYRNRLGENATVLYSGLDDFNPGGRQKIFRPIEEKYNVKIAFGKKYFIKNNSNKANVEVDIAAVDIWNMKSEFVDNFKFMLWEKFGIQSDKYQHDADYEQYLRIGIVVRDIFEAVYGKSEKSVVFSHEYMGIPSALAFVNDNNIGRRSGDKTVFYAHEVATARQVVENHPGHDFSFYNILAEDRDEGESLEKEFGSYEHFSRNELIKRATNLDYIFAVSDITKEEYLYLCPWAKPDKIKTIFNGIQVEKVTYKHKERSSKIIGDYCKNLFNFRPDYIFTHVTRLIISKAIWRDIRLLYHLDEHFAKKGISGFYVLLSTLVGNGRSNEDAARMESEYGWPVFHRKGWPDLIGTEEDIYEYLNLFNARSKAIKGVFINQFGFDNKRCGNRVPEEATLHDLRLASDIEFGLSIYEPFGIAQIENMPYGGVPVVSSACGCVSLLRETADHEDYISIDFSRVPESLKDSFKSKNDFKYLNKELRDWIETEICKESAPIITKILPKTDKERKVRFKRMQKESSRLDWEHVATRITEYLK